MRGYAFAVLRVRMLGDLALELDGVTIDPPAGRRARELIGWLALNPGPMRAPSWPRASGPTCSTKAPEQACARPCTSCGATWGGGRSAHGHTGTRGPGGRGLGRRPRVPEARGEGRNEEALALSRGEPLAGLDEDWVMAARDDHRHAWGRAARSSWPKAAEAGGDPAAAVRFTRELIRVDPSRRSRPAG